MPKGFTFRNKPGAYRLPDGVAPDDRRYGSVRSPATGFSLNEGNTPPPLPSRNRPADPAPQPAARSPRASDLVPPLPPRTRPATVTPPPPPPRGGMSEPSLRASTHTTPGVLSEYEKGERRLENRITGTFAAFGAAGVAGVTSALAMPPSDAALAVGLVSGCITIMGVLATNYFLLMSGLMRRERRENEADHEITMRVIRGESQPA